MYLYKELFCGECVCAFFEFLWDCSHFTDACGWVWISAAPLCTNTRTLLPSQLQQVTLNREFRGQLVFSFNSQTHIQISNTVRNMQSRTCAIVYAQSQASEFSLHKSSLMVTHASISIFMHYENSLAPDSSLFFKGKSPQLVLCGSLWASI